MGKIEIEGMYFYAYHGHYKAEQVVGNAFNVDLAIETNCDRAALSDDLKDAVNYQAIDEAVQVLPDVIAGNLDKAMKALHTAK